MVTEPQRLECHRSCWFIRDGYNCAASRLYPTFRRCPLEPRSNQAGPHDSILGARPGPGSANGIGNASCHLTGTEESSKSPQTDASALPSCWSRRRRHTEVKFPCTGADTDEAWKHEGIPGKRLGIQLKIEACMQQTERQVKDPHEVDMLGHKRAWTQTARIET